MTNLSKTAKKSKTQLIHEKVKGEDADCKKDKDKKDCEPKPDTHEQPMKIKKPALTNKNDHHSLLTDMIHSSATHGDSAIYDLINDSKKKKKSPTSSSMLLNDFMGLDIDDKPDEFGGFTGRDHEDAPGDFDSQMDSFINSLF